MASHKNYIKELRPVTFITFDSNTLWDIDNGNLLYGEELPDESENGAPINALLHSEYIVNRASYRLGQPSMVPNSPTDNYSLVLAPFGKDDVNTFPYSKSWVEIPYEDRIRLEKSFTISCLFNKIRSDTEMRSWSWNSNTQRYDQNFSFVGFERTIFRKGNKIGLKYVMPYGTPEYIEVTFPNNSGRIYNTAIPGGVYNRDICMAMTHEYIEQDDGRYYTISRLYWDNRIIYEHTTSPVFGNYNGGNTSGFDIGGNQDAWAFNSLNDRHTAPFKVDQFAVFDYALQHFQIANIYKKVYPYETIVERSFPYLYYQFNERESDANFNNTHNNTSKLIRYVGAHVTNIHRGQPGIHGVYGGTRVDVKNKGMLYNVPYDINGYRQSFFNPGGDFTVDFFASFTSTSKGVLLSIQDDTQPFRGICLFVNCKDNNHKSGMLQLSISDTQYIMTPEKNIRGEDIIYNDGVVRHYTIRRINNYVELWINAVLIDRIYMTSGSLTTQINQIYLFGLMPGSLTVDGSIQHLALYDRALSQQDIEIRVSYMVKYNVRGRVTVQGVGQTILMRIYSFNSGQLITEQKTDSDGQYVLNIPSDDYINVVAMDVGNINIRPRVIGPILPDEYEDLPWDY